jgi:hypothetical protein
VKNVEEKNGEKLLIDERVLHHLTMGLKEEGLSIKEVGVIGERKNDSMIFLQYN